MARTVGPDGQALLDVALFRVGPEMAGWASGVPEGILRLTPFLMPA